MKKTIFLCLLALGLGQLSAQGNPYFPPTSGNTWDTRSPADLGWCQPRLDSLYTYLDSVNTKAFMILHQGRIVSEQYFNNFGPDSLWYWASAAKTLTAFMVGQAQERGLLNIQDRSSLYLGRGWTSMDSIREDSIRIWHQLTMTTGLDYNVADPYCTLDTCLRYGFPVGSSWYYHNAPYTLLDSVLRVASGQTLNGITNQWVENRIGMDGLWLRIGFNNTFFSNARSMARFGLMVSAGGRWANDTLMRDTAYFRQMISPSQALNPAYGYLWWLNGQSSFRLPQTTLSIPGPLLPNAPMDLYAALGRDDQKIYIVPSLDLVIIRLGEAATGFNLASSSFDNVFWQKMMSVMAGCNTTGIEALAPSSPLAYPNPFAEVLRLDSPLPWRVYDAQGRLLAQGEQAQTLDTQTWPAGLYFLQQAGQTQQLLKH